MATQEIDLGLVRGPKGDKGDIGPSGPTGPQGEPGRGVPASGVIGQVLGKSSLVDYETEWVDPVPPGGIEGQVLTKADGGDYSVKWGGYFSRPNLLDNWYFIGGGSQQGGGKFPINQSEFMEYSRGQYSIDRWRIPNNIGVSLSLKSDSIHITGPTSGQGTSIIEQRFEGIWLMPNDSITFSILYKNLTNKYSIGALYMIDGNVEYSDVFTTNESGLYSWTYNAKKNGVLTACGLLCNSPDSSIDLIAAKLEFGDTQTLAHQDAFGQWVLNDPPPNFQQELAKCQRHFIRFKPNAATPFCYLNPIYVSNNYANFVIYCPVCMRANPAIKFHNMCYSIIGASNDIDIPDNTNIAGNMAGNIKQININMMNIGTEKKEVLRIVNFKSSDSYVDLNANI